MKKKIISSLILLISIIILASCSIPYEAKRSEQIMGTVITITVYDLSKEKAESALNASFEEFYRLDNLLSNFKETSEVSILNRDKIIKNPSKELTDNIKRSLFYGMISNGSFDITVQPILDLYTETFQNEKRPPTEEEVKEAQKRIDYRQIILTENQISIGPDQEITLGGIAKGYAVEKAVDILKSMGIKSALVNAGGNMRAIGKKPDDLPWNIALKNPRNETEYLTMVYLDNNAIATSGDYERYFNENKTFHHIINPKTGYSATELISTTIVTENAFDADALSTTVFVLGKEKGLQLCESLENTSCLIITRNREIIKSSKWKEN